MTSETLRKLDPLTKQKYLQPISANGEHPLLPQYGWRARFDWWPEINCRPYSFPRLAHIPSILPMSFRYLTRFYFHKVWWERRKPFIDGVRQVEWKPIYGVPIGGIGSGTIGRGFRGEFCRYHLIPGMYYHETVPYCQWLVTVRRRGQTVYQQVLSTSNEPSNGGSKSFLSSSVGGDSQWSWGFPTESAAYVGLYPCSHTLYRLPGLNILLLCKQLSPVFPHNYDDSCLPIANFHWSVYNCSNEDNEVSITLMWQASFGSRDNPLIPGSTSSSQIEKDLKTVPKKVVTNEKSESENPLQGIMKGCLLHQATERAKLTFGLAALQSESTVVTTVPTIEFIDRQKKYRCLNALNTDEVWSHLYKTGRLPPQKSVKLSVNEKLPASNGIVCPDGGDTERLAAVCVTVNVPAESICDSIRFVLTWNSPIVFFRSKEIPHKRRYLRWFSEDETQGTIELLTHAFQRWNDWVNIITNWQLPFLQDAKLPSWYKSALFNELYFVADGGTVWVDPVDFSLDHELDNIPVKKEIGYFGYLEGHEYRMYNTYDVHYYASWALIKLWPKLQLAIQYDIGYLTKASDSRPVFVIHSGSYEKRSRPRCVPHDIGDPEDEPWSRINAYIMYDTDDWKDLNCKFLLQVYRDWIILGDRKYMEWMLPICIDVVRRSLLWDTDDDGIIDNGGYADQTYDVWTVSGASAYTGGLWIAGLYATCQMMTECGMDNGEFYDILLKAKVNFEKKLWNGNYFLYDNSGGKHHRAIMSDQLNGHWYLKSSRVHENAVFPQSHVRRALQTIYEHNVCQVGCPPSMEARGSNDPQPVCSNEPELLGQMGAVNGMMPGHGQRDRSSIQSEEFWVGVNYSLAATCIMEGLPKEGMQIAKGCYETVWQRFGLQYQSPEAYLESGQFRSLGYMRPLCVWAIQHALDELNISSDTQLPDDALL